jgi:CDP-glycerol glycerophosphotransferase (TagB/SpsB family)
VPPKLAALPRLLTDVPGRPSPVFTDRDINADDLRHLAATMRYSDVVVNLASTITIDAAVCGTPAVCVGFDETPGKPYLQSVRRYYDFAHYQSLLSTGGVQVARTMDELVEKINEFLENKDRNREARQRILDMHCGALDGRAGERIGQYVLRYLDEVTRTR